MKRLVTASLLNVGLGAASCTPVTLSYRDAVVPVMFGRRPEARSVVREAEDRSVLVVAAVPLVFSIKNEERAGEAGRAKRRGDWILRVSDVNAKDYWFTGWPPLLTYVRKGFDVELVAEPVR